MPRACGHTFPPPPRGREYRDGDCRVCWLAANRPDHPAVTGVRPTAPPRRDDRCEHLGGRTEYRAGCGGMGCRHDCDLGLPAVPNAHCQRCPSYSPDPGVPWVG